MAKFEIIIDDKDFKRALRKMEFRGQKNKELKKVLRKAAKPWAEHANSKVYNYLQRDTGNMAKAIGIGTFESKSRNYVGVKARPKAPPKYGLERNGGWRAHFFAKPARQISPAKRIPWATIYSQRNADVIANVVKGVRALFKKEGLL